MRDRTGLRMPTPADTHRDPVVRKANALDRYSLALQLIQVFPIIVAGAAVILPIRWLQIAVAVSGLVFWTLRAVLRERGAEAGGPAASAGLPYQSTEFEVVPIVTTTAESDHEIRVEIWLRPHSPAPHGPAVPRPRHRRSLPRGHKAIPPRPHPNHHQSHADEPEPEDGPGNPPRLRLSSGRGAEAGSVHSHKENPWATKPSSIW